MNKCATKKMSYGGKSEGKELAKDVKVARRIEKEELEKKGLQRIPKTKTPRLGGVGGGGMNPIDLEKVPGKKPLKMARGGKAEGKMMKSKGRNMTKAAMQKIAAKKVRGHEARMHKGKK